MLNKNIKKDKREMPINTLVRFIVLGWSAGMLTFSYMGVLSKMDPTFIASIFTGTLATFGVQALGKKDEDDNQVKIDGRSNSTDINTKSPGRPRKVPTTDSELDNTTVSNS